MRLYARNMSHDRNRHAGMLSPRPHARRTLSTSGASGQMSPFTCLHASSREAGAPARQSVASSRNSRCQAHANRAIFQMPSSPAEKSRPPLPQTASGTARRADPKRSPPANTRRARHRRARRRRARHLACASRTRVRRREQSGMRRRPRASGRPRQCVRPDSR